MNRRTTNFELIATAMPYLDQYDLSNDALLHDYQNWKFGDFIVKLCYRIAHEQGKILRANNITDFQAGMTVHQMDVLPEVIADFITTIHRNINNVDKHELGILTPGCGFFHAFVDELDLPELHPFALYPYRAYHMRYNPEMFQEVESLSLNNLYTQSLDAETLFHFSKIYFHSSVGHLVKKAYFKNFKKIIDIYDGVEFEQSLEIADFSVELQKIRVEADAKIFEKDVPLYEYKDVYYSKLQSIVANKPSSEPTFEKKVLENRIAWDRFPRRDMASVLDILLHSNIGHIDNEFGARAVRLLDYHLSLRLPMDEIKDAMRKAYDELHD